MILLRVALALALIALVPSGARAQEETGLLYVSAEATDKSRYGGVGWMRAPGGLDASGAVQTLEFGRSFAGNDRLGLMAGWRFVKWHVYATGLIGLEVGTRTQPAASLDLWWNEGAYMASARMQVVERETTGRLSAGWRGGEDGLWYGPEVSRTWQGTRFGVHVTGLHLPRGFEARVSAGPVAGHPFAELSLWRRF